MDTFFQAGALVAFLQGIYDGDVNFAELSKLGDFGLGTLNGVDGEMVAVDGNFYRIDANGVASIIPPTTQTPFSVVSQFKPVKSFTIKNVASLADLNQLLDSHLSTSNIFYMIRIDGELEWVKLRSEKCQMRPYRPLAETLPQLQHIFELNNSTGTLVVSRCPDYSSAVTIPGYHYHYIDDDRKTGGHVFDLKLKSAEVMINPLRQFNMALFDTEEFDNADLEIDIQEALKKIE
jgi:acetolactate decarboxylase